MIGPLTPLRRMNKTTPRSKNRRKKEGVTDLPVYCDFSCRFATFAPSDSVGACGREQAVYCTLLRQFNSKNSRCAVQRG
jgi:hypothetical protein